MGFYIHHPGFIDNTRYHGGYKDRTRPRFNEAGELVFEIDESGGYQDALPREPLHFAVGDYPLLDSNPHYRIRRQFGKIKLYEFVKPSSKRG